MDIQITQRKEPEYQVLEWQRHDIENYTKEQCTYILLGLIEKGDLPAIRQFYQKHPHLRNKIVGLNQWTPAMYAARYGNVPILRFFRESGFDMESKGCPHGIVMSACFGNSVQSMWFLLKQCGLSANPESSEISPLRYCLKNGLYKLGSLLLSFGAYYYISPKLWQGVRKEEERFVNLKGVAVLPDHVYKQGDFATDRENTRTRLRMARVYNLLALRTSANVNEGGSFDYLKLHGNQLRTIMGYMISLDP